MSNWLTQAINQAESLPSDWLSPKRAIALEALRQQSWPSRRTEAWKYTPVNLLERAKFSADSPVAAVDTAIEGLEAIELNLVDGQLAQLPRELPEGLTIQSFSSASSDTQAWALEAFNATKPARHLFGLVNDTLAEQGLIIDVAPGAKIETPVRIVQQFSAASQSHHRILMRVGEGASASVIEQLAGDHGCFNTSFAEYQLAEGAKLEHYRLALQTARAISVGGSHFDLASKSELNSSLVGFGSDLSRVDMDIIHSGPHAFAKLNVIYLLDNTELFDLHSCIEHAVPNGTTEENIRVIAADRANAVFNGRIHIHRDAQKTLAEMNNRNLLMSDDAQINTKPELEIYADDVRCAHGATIAEMDDKALYYMQSRGVSRKDAQVMLSFGFINELVDQMPNQALAQWLRPLLRERFANMEVK